MAKIGILAFIKIYKSIFEINFSGRCNVELIEEIRLRAMEFRGAIETLRKSDKISEKWFPYGRFPDGCCGEISKILIQHFKILGYGDAVYMSGIDCLISSHAWIRLHGICVDITADQFNNKQYPDKPFTFGCYPSVIVEFEENYPLKEIFPLDKQPKTRQDFDHQDQVEIYNLIKQHLNLV